MKHLSRLGGIVLGAFMTVCIADPTAMLEKLPLPNGPLLNRMSEFSAVQTVYAYAEDKAKPAIVAATPAPVPIPSYTPSSPARLVTLTRTKFAWHVVRVDILGSKVEQWSDGKDVFCEASGLSDPILEMRGQTTGFPDYTKVDFPDMEWISPETYQGMQNVGGARCLVFLKDEMTAWVSLESRLPVQWQEGGETRVFKQLSPPTEILEMPPKIAAFAAVLKHDRTNLLRPVVPGG